MRTGEAKERGQQEPQKVKDNKPKGAGEGQQKMSWVLRGRWQDPGKLLVSFGRKRVTFKGYAKGHTNQHLCTLEPVAWVHGIGGRAWLWVSPGEEIQYTEIRWSVERRTGPKWVERRRVPSACFTPSRPQRVCYAPSPAPPPNPRQMAADSAGASEHALG